MSTKKHIPQKPNDTYCVLSDSWKPGLVNPFLVNSSVLSLAGLDLGPLHFIECSLPGLFEGFLKQFLLPCASIKTGLCG